jgi:hypothetical protein
MRNIRLFATAAIAALIVAGVGGWTAASNQAFVQAPKASQLDLFQMTITAKNLPSQKYDDLSVVFN